MSSEACEECGALLIEWAYKCRVCAGEFCPSCINENDRCDYCEGQVDFEYGDETEEEDAS
mgnify:CR=1 FL=1